MMLKCALVGSLLLGVSANDNGLALTPPRGWRSWNLYGNNVNQSLIESIMTGMTKKRNGESLCDLGYCDVGLDDNWQACNSPDAAKGMHYHDNNGNPLINLKTFPDMKKMTDHAHSLKLTSGWYGNNCDCSDHCSDPYKTGGQCESQIKGDVNALVGKFNFDAWKLDGCGGEKDLVLINKHIKAAGKAIMLENCHWGRVAPAIPDPSKDPAEGCPWNFYRTSGDVRASYASIIGNLATTVPLAGKNLSYPGCWAYPDMLQVGCAHGPGGKRDPGLSPQETRTHFGSWSIVSSPLTLSHDVNDDAISEAIWPVITNKEVLAVSQAYEGHSGTKFSESEETVELTDAFIEANEHEQRVTAQTAQFFYKPIADGKVAVLAMNAQTTNATLSFKLSDVPGIQCTSCHVRDIWAHKDLGVSSGSWSGTVEGHDAAFLVLGTTGGSIEHMFSAVSGYTPRDQEHL